MPDWTTLVSACYIRPSFQLMVQAYEEYRLDSAPCKAGITNQCAVRMSVALERCGFGLDAFDPHRRVHSGRSRCQLTVQHVVGARELADYLTRIWGAPERWRGGSVNSAAADLAGRTGIVYFNNCFQREGQAARTGDHIDLWNGRTYYNQIIHVGAGGDAAAGTPLFGRSDEVWFFPLSA
jgi:hypothetical protein